VDITLTGHIIINLLPISETNSESVTHLFMAGPSIPQALGFWDVYFQNVACKF
jgi:hypothetical protein